MVSIFSLMEASSGYRNLKSPPLSAAALTTSAASWPPSPPSAWTLIGTASSAPAAMASLRTISTSLSRSKAKRLMVTTTGTPKSFMFSICLARFSQPFVRASLFSALSSSGSTGRPPCILRARMVQVMTTALGREAAVAADDVHELLGAEVGGEAALGDDVVAELHGDLVGDDRVVALGDVGERAGMDERGVALERLHEVRLDGVLEEHRHGAAGADVVGRQRLARLAVAEGDAAEALAQVLERRGEAEDGHDLAGDGDVVAGLARDAVELAAEAVDDLAHGAVVEVDAAAPRDGQRVDVRARCRA